MAKDSASPLRSGKRQRCLLSPPLFNFVLDILANAKKKKKKKTSRLEKEVKLVFFADNIIVYVGNFMKST